MTLSLKETFIKMNSTRNLAVWDRVLRGALPFVIGALWWAEIIPTAVALPTGIISLMLLPTAFTGACSIDRKSVV